ncbi:branched-chain amino acid aminotransferase [Propionibacteriaceae bacterium Y2011]
MALMFERRTHPSPASTAERNAILANPGFGKHFTDHMAVATWTRADGWLESGVVPYGPFQLDPATAVLHYAQEVFEGLKAYRWADDSIRLFRPELNAARMQRSAERLALPALDETDFLASIEGVVRADRDWVPSGGETSLYLRPFLFASEAFLGVRPAHRVTYCCIASPAGAYFSGGVKPVNIWVSEKYTRASPGGTGAAKCGGNYAASLIAQAEAAEHGCEQVLFADAQELRYVEELGGMNVYFVRDGQLHTPELTGSLLEGVTRDSVLALAADLGLEPVQRRIEVAELLSGMDDGSISEVFACGTAAVVTPIGALKTAERSVSVSDPEKFTVTAEIRQRLLDIQYGRAEDSHGWTRKIS